MGSIVSQGFVEGCIVRVGHKADPDANEFSPGETGGDEAFLEQVAVDDDGARETLGTKFVGAAVAIGDVQDGCYFGRVFGHFGKHIGIAIMAGAWPY